MDWWKVERRLERGFSARPRRFGATLVSERRRPFRLAPAIEETLSEEEVEEFDDLEAWPGSLSELLEQNEIEERRLLDFYWDGWGPTSSVAGLVLIGNGRKRYLAYSSHCRLSAKQTKSGAGSISETWKVPPCPTTHASASSTSGSPLRTTSRSERQGPDVCRRQDTGVKATSRPAPPPSPDRNRSGASDLPARRRATAQHSARTGGQSQGPVRLSPKQPSRRSWLAQGLTRSVGEGRLSENASALPDHSQLREEDAIAVRPDPRDPSPAACRRRLNTGPPAPVEIWTTRR